MVTKSDFDEGRSKVLFDRVELEGLSVGDRAFELARGVNLTEKALRSVTWVYDSRSDTVVWSDSLEEFFGFEDRTSGFSVRSGDTDSAGPPHEDASPVHGPTLHLRSVDDAGDALLAPILTPIRLGHPPATFDLNLVVNCPDGTDHQVVVRAAPIDDPTASGQPVGGATPPTLYVGVVIDVTAKEAYERELGEMVDRYRLLTEVSPDAVFVHQEGRLVYWNRAGTRLAGMGTSDEAQVEAYTKYYGLPITTFLHPDDVPQVAQRLSQLTEPGQFFEHGEIRVVTLGGTVNVMEVTSVRTTWGGEPAFQVIARDISERKAAEAADRYKASLVAHVSDAIIGIDADGRIESWNAAAQVIYGWAEEEVIGHAIGTVVSNNRTDSMAILERGQRSHRRKDGSTVDVAVSIDPLVDDDAQPSGWVVVCTELTDARQAEAGRRAAEERYEAVVASLSEGIILFDEAGRMNAHNQAAATILGDRLTRFDGYRLFTGDSVATSADDVLLTPDQFPHVRTQRTGEPEDGVVIGVSNGLGGFQWLSMSTRLLTGATAGDVPMVVCSFTDVTDRKHAESELQWMAFHDSLTTLGNRQQFTKELEQELALSMQHRTSLAVLFIDLDRFKLVNDSYGHASGDELLIELARRFKANSRRGDVVSRFSGDEFVVLCPDVRDLDHALELAAEYAKVTEAPFHLSTVRSVVVTASVGVAYVSEGNQSAQDILQQADTAMFEAKKHTQSRIEVFDESLRENSVERLELLEDLRHAIDNDELVVYYQPIASVETGRIVALEALVRWNHPTRGLLGPMAFIPLAEDSGLIDSLGRWVLREACATMAGWRNQVPGAEDAYISVNLSVQQLNDSSLLDSIAGALSDSGLPPEGLVLEVTESLLMSENAEDALNGIHDMGVALAIDDFGTDQSSMKRLKQFTVKILKIDKSFVDGLGTIPTDEAIVAAIVHMSKALDLVVLAEGVETPKQLEMIADLGCDLYQGYLMSRPVSAEQIDFAKSAETTPQTDLPS